MIFLRKLTFCFEYHDPLALFKLQLSSVLALIGNEGYLVKSITEWVEQFNRVIVIHLAYIANGLENKQIIQNTSKGQKGKRATFCAILDLVHQSTGIARHSLVLIIRYRDIKKSFQHSRNIYLIFQRKKNEYAFSKRSKMMSYLVPGFLERYVTPASFRIAKTSLRNISFTFDLTKTLKIVFKTSYASIIKKVVELHISPFV